MTEEDGTAGAGGERATLRTSDRLRSSRRSGGRAGNMRGKGAAIAQMPWSVPVNLDNPIEPLPPEGVEAIHDNAMRILEEIGIAFTGGSFPAAGFGASRTAAFALASVAVAGASGSDGATRFST